MSGATGSALAGEPASAPPYGPHATAEGGGGAPSGARAVVEARIAFEAVGRGHLGLLRGWFGEPHVLAWWGPPEEELAAVEADLGGGGFAMWIASLDGVPFAYVQDGPPEQAEEPYYAGAPAGWRAVDVLIGARSHLGRGLAAPMLRAFADHAAARGVPGLLIDPDAANEPAVQAYLRAGFHELRRHRCEDGKAIVMHMPLPRGAS